MLRKSFVGIGMWIMLMGALVVPQSLSMSRTQPPSGMVAWLPLDETSGQTANDPKVGTINQNDKIGSDWFAYYAGANRGESKPVMHLSEGKINDGPQGDYRIVDPPHWYHPPIKVNPGGSRMIIFKVFSIGTENLLYMVSSDHSCIQVSVPPTMLPPGDSATISVMLNGSGACNGTFIAGNVILTTNEVGGTVDSLRVHAVVAEDYYECPRDTETYDTRENGVLRFYTNANCEEWIHDIGTRPDTTFETFFRGGTIVATTQDGDTMVGRFMGENDWCAGAQDKLYTTECDVDWEPDFWLLYTKEIYIEASHLTPPHHLKWWWWEVSKQIKIFKPGAPEVYQHIVIKYVTVTRKDPPGWWPDQSPFTGYEDTYIGMAMDIDCPWDTMGHEMARNRSGYDDSRQIAWLSGFDYTGAHPQYNNYYAGMALAEGGTETPTTPYGVDIIKNNRYLYPTIPWGWKDGELYQLASTPGVYIQDSDSLVDRSIVLTAYMIPAGYDTLTEASFTVIEAVAPNGLAQLQEYIDSARAIVARERQHGLAALCGDVDGDYDVDQDDVDYLVAYLEESGPPPPCPIGRADVNGDGVVNTGDVTTLEGYLEGYLDNGGVLTCPGIPLPIPYSVKCYPYKSWESLSGKIDFYSTTPPPDPPPTPSSGLLLRWPCTPRGYDDYNFNKCFYHTFYVPPSGIKRAWVLIGMRPVKSSLSNNDRIALVFTKDDGTSAGYPEWSQYIGRFGTVLGIFAKEWTTVNYNYVVKELDLSNLPLNSYNLIPSLNEAGFLDLFVEDDTDIDFAELLVCYTDSCVRAPVGMVAWWPMNEQVGATVVEDIAGAGYHPGTPSPGGQIGDGNPAFGPMPTTGKVGGALYFWYQEVNRFVRVSTKPDIEFGTTDFSIDAWVKIIRGQTGNFQPIVEKMQYTGTTPERGYRFYMENWNLFFTLAWGPGTASTIQAPFPIQEGWHHVAVTVDRNPDGWPYIRLYIDGTLAQDGSIVFVTSIANTEDLIIGGSLLGASIYYFDISIDEVELFDRALNDYEVHSIFQADHLGKCKAYISGMKFNDYNGNGTKETGEQGLANWTIFIDTDPFNHVLGQGETYTTTNASGNYSFTVPVPPTEYTICEVNQSDWTQTCPSACYTVTVSENQSVIDRDFGNYCGEPCPNNVVQNWSFTPASFTPWIVAYGSPDVSVGLAWCDSGTVGMWGNKVAGEAIYQTLAAPDFAPGWTYAIKFHAKWAPAPNRPYPVQFEFRASIPPLTSPIDINGVSIGVSAPVTPAQQWMSMGPIYWTVPPGPTYSILTVSATNQSSASHPDSTSYGAVDRICITKFKLGDVNGSGEIELGDIVYLITYLYKSGPAPLPMEAGDVNCSGIVELGDIVYLITYLYKNGPPPSCN